MTNHRRSPSIVLSSLIAATAIADPAPTTQACLGDLDTFLACPPGAQRSGTECRAREPQRGQGAGEHWSGSKRAGPAIFLRDDDETDPAKQRVSFAAYYKDHKKTGRVFRFDDTGILASWTDLAGDDYHGLSVTCLPDGRVWYMASYQRDRQAGVSRAWNHRTGALSYAFEHDGNGKSRRLDPTPALEQRPDHLCRPARCDVTATPDLSGLPKP